MTMKQEFAVTAALMLASWSLLFGQTAAAPAAPCEAPSYFGMCDPYVPGIIASSGPGGSLLVRRAWPSSPADQAGVCPGDNVISINGTPTSGQGFDDIIKRVVSEKPTPLDLKIARGEQVLDFHLDRVKETQLAALSKEKWVHLPIFPDGNRLMLVPTSESLQELQAFREFELALGKRNGFKLAADFWLPSATDEDQFERLEQVLNDPLSSRLAARVRFTSSAYDPGFFPLVLQHPYQVVVLLIEAGSPAFQAGLLPGDEITEVDGHSVSGLSPEQFSDLVLKPDDHARQIELRVRRGATDQTIKIDTAKWLDSGFGITSHAQEMSHPRQMGEYRAGIQLANLVNPKEMLVQDVIYPSAAFAAGMHVGDAILAVNGQPAKQITREQMENFLNPPSPAPLRIDALRLGKKIHFELTPMTEAQAQASIGRKMTAHGPASTKCTEASQ